MNKLRSSAKTIPNIIVMTLSVIAIGSFGRPYLPLLKMSMGEPQDSLLVDREGNRYPIKKMLDNNLWMTANLKLNISDSYCYENIKENCEQYGRLYTWESAQKGCSLLGEGWRLPTNDEWQQLAMYYGFPLDSVDYRKGAYKALLLDGNARFNVVMGGGRDPEGNFGRLNAHGFFWTATENDNSTAWSYNFGKGAKLIFQALVGLLETSYLSACALNQGSSLFFHSVHSCKSLLDRYNLL